MSVSPHIQHTNRYHVSIEKPIQVKKAIQISLNSCEGFLSVEQPRGDLPFNSAKIVFNSLESGEQFLVKTSLLEKEMRKFNVGNFDYQSLLAGREFKEGKNVLPRQVREAFKTELVKRSMTLKNEGILFNVPIQSFNLSFLRKITQSRKEQPLLVQRPLEVAPLVAKDLKLTEAPLKSSSTPSALHCESLPSDPAYQRHVFEQEILLMESLRSNLTNDYEEDLPEQDVDFVMSMFSKIQRNRKEVSIEEERAKYCQELEREMESGGKSSLIKALRYVIQRSGEKY